jgi:hypothetical protein
MPPIAPPERLEECETGDGAVVWPGVDAAVSLASLVLVEVELETIVEAED